MTHTWPFFSRWTWNPLIFCYSFIKTIKQQLTKRNCKYWLENKSKNIYILSLKWESCRWHEYCRISYDKVSIISLDSQTKIVTALSKVILIIKLSHQEVVVSVHDVRCIIFSWRGCRHRQQWAASEQGRDRAAHRDGHASLRCLSAAEVNPTELGMHIKS